MSKDLYYYVRTSHFLRCAWRVIHKSAITSQSPETRNEIKQYEPDLEKHLGRIKNQLRAGKYRFQPARGIAVTRPGKSPRPIVIGQVSDRIVQRSLLDVIQDQDSMQPLIRHTCSFGGIPERSVRQAIEAACEAIRNGSTHYIKSDIRSYYANIPRRHALSLLQEHLSDSSLNHLLEEATRVELENVEILKSKYPGLFPSYELGVAQGYCLSPLLGNVLLNEFDRKVNNEKVTCLRFIDDFIILAPDKEQAWSAFRKALKILKSLKLAAYRPNDNSGKSLEGTTSKAFSFLGCSISGNFVHPDKDSRNRLLAKVKTLLNESGATFDWASGSTSKTYEWSLINTLRKVHQLVRAWGNHYSFCNSNQVFEHLDQKIDILLRNYIGAYGALRGSLDCCGRRRILGVHLLTDSKSDPILPL